MSREEAAAKAVNSDFSLQWEKLPDWVKSDYMREMTTALAAADAHDAANGVHRLVIDAATVERAARALCESIWKLPNAWELSSDLSKSSYRKHARLLLAAAVKEDRE